MFVLQAELLDQFEHYDDADPAQADSKDRAAVREQQPSNQKARRQQKVEASTGGSAGQRLPLSITAGDIPVRAAAEQQRDSMHTGYAPQFGDVGLSAAREQQLERSYKQQASRLPRMQPRGLLQEDRSKPTPVIEPHTEFVSVAESQPTEAELGIPEHRRLQIPPGGMPGQAKGGHKELYRSRLQLDRGED